MHLKQLGRGISMGSGAKDHQGAALTKLLPFFIKILQTSDFLSEKGSIRREFGWKSETNVFSLHRNRGVTIWTKEQGRRQQTCFYSCITSQGI